MAAVILFFRLIEELKISNAKQLDELTLRHKAEMRGVEERVEAEYKCWEECQQRKKEGDIISKEREIRKQLKEERDKVHRGSCIIPSNGTCYWSWC